MPCMKTVRLMLQDPATVGHVENVLCSLAIEIVFRLHIYSFLNGMLSGCYGVARLLLRCCYGVARGLLWCCYMIGMVLLGFAMVLLGGCYGVSRWLLWGC